MAKRIELDGVEYGKPEDHYDGRRKVAARQQTLPAEQSDIDPLDKQVGEGYEKKIGPYSGKVEVEVEAVSRTIALILWDSEDFERDSQVTKYLESRNNIE